jgi:transaldolase
VIESLKVKIFADVATEEDILNYESKPHIKGFTTNPSLLKKSGVADYELFAKKAALLAKDKSISFEVVADNDDDIYAEACTINSWAANIYVKIPFLKTDGSDNTKIIGKLAKAGVKLNITAILTLEQVEKTLEQANANVPMIVSVFAGRVADTGIDPLPIMTRAKALMKNLPLAELLWASSREILNVIHAEDSNCDIITLTPDLLNKFKLWGMDLNEYSRQTAEMFYKDAQSAGLKININNDQQKRNVSNG